MRALFDALIERRRQALTKPERRLVAELTALIGLALGQAEPVAPIN